MFTFLATEPQAMTPLDSEASLSKNLTRGFPTLAPPKEARIVSFHSNTKVCKVKDLSTNHD